MKTRLTRLNVLAAAGWLALISGVLLLAWAAVASLERGRAQRQGREELAEQASTEAPVTVISPRRRPAPGETVGRIRIAAAGIDAIAFEGIGSAILKRGVGHFPGTGLPGENANASFAAHRDSFFRGLGEVAIGDLVEVETAHDAHSYRVTETRVVDPDQVEVVADRGKAELTLVTCFPFDYVGPAPRRFVLHAELAPESE